jgi:ribonuclease Y
VEYIFGLVGAVVGAVVAWMLARKDAGTRREQAELEARATKERAELDAERIKSEAELSAKEEMLKLREEHDARLDKERDKLRGREREHQKREDGLSDRERGLDKRQRMLQEVEDRVTKEQGEIRTQREEAMRLLDEQKERLSQLAGMTAEQARDQLLETIRADVAEEEEKLIAKSEENIRAVVEERSRDIVATSVQRIAAGHTSEITVSTIDIPNDDIKGRIIGREGRNIRAFEKAAGVDVIVDDTPGVVLVSAFDGVRRETARRAMNKLVKDGRIHPARIEEVVRQTATEMEEDINSTGKRAVMELNIGKLHPKLVHLVGRLKYRTSYGQNVLQHSIEAAHVCGLMAAELGLDARLGRRCGLLHDVGKSIDHEVEGGHPAVGADVARRCGETPLVVNAIAAHHEDVPMESHYAVLTAAADAVSASRPGARRDTLERYIQRLQRLEEIAMRYEGVDQAYAIQAGRELRVMVNPNKIGDRTSQRLAREIARSIEDELTYPGEVKVTLLRETRVTDYAR